MASAKSLGFAKGDFVFTGMFPGIIIGDAHTSTPLCEVWGIEQEMGSCYASDLRRILYTEFVELLKQHGHNDGGLSAYSEESKRVIKKHMDLHTPGNAGGPM